MRRNIFIWFIFLMFLSCHQNNNTNSKEKPRNRSKFHWHWQDDFTKAEKEKIKKYITAVSLSAFQVLGEYPFEVHYYFKRSDDESSPIPWAHTMRSKKIQGVKFYINPKLDSAILYRDWTAPHEISHLAIPYLGPKYSWFSEGFASYMQYQIMQEMGIYSKEEVAKKYQEKIENIKVEYSDSIPFVENAKILRERYNFKAMYWGGARYFMEIDKLLNVNEEMSLNTIIKKYQSGTRKTDKNIEMLLESLDKDLKIPVFKGLFEKNYLKSFKEIYES